MSAVQKGVSLKPEQWERLGKHLNLKRHGAFSQFVQDAVDEKLDRDEPLTQLTETQDKKAS
jgi:hypothetical protein